MLHFVPHNENPIGTLYWPTPTNQALVSGLKKWQRIQRTGGRELAGRIKEIQPLIFPLQFASRDGGIPYTHTHTHT